MSSIVVDPELVAKCGLYCGACRSYRRGKCPGCAENLKAGWCKVRACGLEHGYATCADCQQFADVADCALFNNVMARLFGFIFRSNREACIARIREIGVEAFAQEMATSERMTIRR